MNFFHWFTDRRRNYREEEKEPEWFTEGPTSQDDRIELRGFEKLGESEKDNPRYSKQRKGGEEKAGRNYVDGERASKGMFYGMFANLTFIIFKKKWVKINKFSFSHFYLLNAKHIRI